MMNEYADKNYLEKMVQDLLVKIRNANEQSDYLILYRPPEKTKHLCEFMKLLHDRLAIPKKKTAKASLNVKGNVGKLSNASESQSKHDRLSDESFLWQLVEDLSNMLPDVLKQFESLKMPKSPRRTRELGNLLAFLQESLPVAKKIPEKRFQNRQTDHSLEENRSDMQSPTGKIKNTKGVKKKLGKKTTDKFQKPDHLKHQEAKILKHENEHHTNVKDNFKTFSAGKTKQQNELARKKKQCNTEIEKSKEKENIYQRRNDCRKMSLKIKTTNTNVKNDMVTTDTGGFFFTDINSDVCFVRNKLLEIDQEKKKMNQLYQDWLHETENLKRKEEELSNLCVQLERTIESQEIEIVTLKEENRLQLIQSDKFEAILLEKKYLEESLNHQKQMMDSSCKKCNELNATSEQLLQEKDNLDKYIIDLERKASKTAAEITQTIDENNKLTQKVHSLRKENSTLCDQLAIEQEKALQREKENNEIIMNLKRKAEKQHNEICSLSTSNDALQEKCKMLTQTVEDLHQRQSNATINYESYKKLMETEKDLVKEKRQIREELRTAKEENRQLQHDKKTLLANLDREKDNVSKNGNEIKKLNEELKQIKDQRIVEQNYGDQLHTKNEMLQMEVNKLEKENKILQESITASTGTFISQEEATKSGLNEKIQMLQKELKQLQYQKKLLREELGIQKERERIKEVENNDNNTKFQLINNKQEKEISSLREALKTQSDINEAQEKENRKQLQERNKLNEVLMAENEKAKHQIDEYKKKSIELQQIIEIQKREVANIKAANTKLQESVRNELAGVKDKLTDNSDYELQQQLTHVREQLKSTQQELDDTKSRLSRAMGDKLTDNNPNIADLSDKNRPTKISERYQELYDNQWTDAFETVDGAFGNEDKTISVLMDILLKTMEFCKAESAHQMKLITDTLSKDKSLPASIMKQLKDCRKSSAENYGKALLTEYWTKLSQQTSEIASIAKQIPHFVEECFEICWLMAVQDPPVVLGPEIRRDAPFNKDHYKAYTRSGSKLDYIVWPVLLLHHGGPVLCKGVAQGH